MPGRKGQKWGTRTKSTQSHIGSMRSRAPPIPKKGKPSKKSVVRARQQVVETKSRTHEEMALETVGKTGDLFITNPTDYRYLSNTTAYTFMFPLSYLSMNQGLSEQDMVGQTVMSKYLKMKLNLLLPYGTNAITKPFNLYVVHGFVNAPMFSGSVFGAHSISASSAKRSDIQNFIKNRVIAYFDERKDKLRFIEKNGVTCNIIGYKKILNDKNTSWLADLTSAQSPKTISLKWPMMAKTKYEIGSPTPAEDNNTLSASNHLYPNYRRLPFALVYSPQWESIQSTIDDQKIGFAFNDIHYFTDS